MTSKATQLTLSFCGALASMLLISAPINEMVALAGSGTAFLISAVCFYGGMNKYFADKETQMQSSGQLTELLIKNQSNINKKLEEITESVANLKETLATPLNDISEAVSITSNEMQKIGFISESIEKNITKNQSDINNKIDEIIDSIANLEESLATPLENISETLSSTSSNVKKIANASAGIENNAEKIQDLNKSAKHIFEEIEDLSSKIENISEIKSSLQELITAINQQEQFYKTMMNQYNSMNGKDIELIENLARRLR